MMRTLEHRQKKENREQRQSVRILADEFGRQRGWLRSRSAFSIEQLHRRSSKIRAKEDTAFNVDTVFYRERQRPYRPAAIVAHYASWPEIGPELERICEEFGLRYEAVADFPCWIDGAQLIVFTSATKEGQRQPKKVGRKGARCLKQFTLPFE